MPQLSDFSLRLAIFQCLPGRDQPGVSLFSFFTRGLLTTKARTFWMRMLTLNMSALPHTGQSGRRLLLFPEIPPTWALICAVSLPVPKSASGAWGVGDSGVSRVRWKTSHERTKVLEQNAHNEQRGRPNRSSNLQRKARLAGEAMPRLSGVGVALRWWGCVQPSWLPSPALSFLS